VVSLADNLNYSFSQLCPTSLQLLVLSFYLFSYNTFQLWIFIHKIDT